MFSLKTKKDIWSPNVVKRGLCYQNVCPSFCLSVRSSVRHTGESHLIGRKSRTGFSLVPKLMTMNDLERSNGRYFALFYRIRYV